MKLLQRYLLCQAALLLLFSAYCQRFGYNDLNSLTGSMTIIPEIENKSYSFSYSGIKAKAFSKDIVASTRIIKPGIANYPTQYFYPRVKYLISGYPFKDVSPFFQSQKTFKIGGIFYTDTVLTGGVWQGAFIGGLIGIATAGITIAVLNEDEWLSPTSAQRVEMVGWGALNGAGIGGLAGFGKQRKRQRQLNNKNCPCH